MVAGVKYCVRASSLKAGEMQKQEVYLDWAATSVEV